MNRQETKMILEILKSLYPNDFKNKDADDMKLMLDIWNELLIDDDANVIANAIKVIALNGTSAFMPTIGIIRNKAYELTHKDEFTEQEAWNCVYKAIMNSGYHAKKEWEKLPDVVKGSVTPEQLREWSQMDTDKLETVVSSNFMRSYKVRSKYSKEQNMLPNQIKLQIDSIKNKLLLESKEYDED